MEPETKASMRRTPPPEPPQVAVGLLDPGEDQPRRRRSLREAVARVIAAGRRRMEQIGRGVRFPSRRTSTLS